jgi:alpha-beta hydrolase superfamily lysophospholipase
MTDPDVSKLREEFKEPHELVKVSDGKVIFLRHWVGSERTDLAILVFHGITAYSEPYGKLLAEDLARTGFNVFGMDLRGHGRSDGRRGDYPGGERLSEDLCETLAFLRGRFSKVVVLGHSLGVLSAVVAVNSYPANVDGLILLSAGRKVRPGAYSKPPAGVALKTLLGITLLPRSRLIEYRRRGMGGRGDPLFNFHYTARFYSTLYGTSAWSVVRMLGKNEIVSPNLVISGRMDIPVLVGVGDQDELFSVDSVRAFFDSVGCSRKEFFVIPGGRHAAFPTESWDPLIAWLRANYPAKPVS